MATEKKHIAYSAEDIRRYLSGGMDNAEMHAIEMAALDDPFLAEAIEGYELVAEKDWTLELAALKVKLAAVENKPLAPVYQTNFTRWWKAAAAVLVIGSSIAVAFLFTKKQEGKEQLAVNREEVAPAITQSTAPADSASTAGIATGNSSKFLTNRFDSTAASSQTDLALNDKYKVQIQPSTAYAAEDAVTDDFVYRPSAPVAKTELKDNGRREDDAEKSTIASTEEVAVSGNTSPGYNQGIFNNSPAQNNRFHNESVADKNNGVDISSNNARIIQAFNARVVTADDKPVAFANVSIPQYKSPIFTDGAGNLHFKAADSVVTVNVVAAGYAPRKVTLNTNTNFSNKIVLEPNDVVVKTISSGVKQSAAEKLLAKKKARTAAAGEDNMEDEIDEDDAAPSGGWVQYNNYLNNNMVFPSEARRKNIHGEVEVYVKLKSNGEISTVKVGKTLCPECDAEAIRLVTEGPKWDMKKNKAGKVKVKIKF